MLITIMFYNINVIKYCLAMHTPLPTSQTDQKYKMLCFERNAFFFIVAKTIGLGEIYKEK